MKQAQNQKQRHDIGDVFTIEAAQELYDKHRVATIITDGRYTNRKRTHKPASQIGSLEKYIFITIISRKGRNIHEKFSQ